MISISIQAKDAQELQFHVKQLSTVFKKTKVEKTKIDSDIPDGYEDAGDLKPEDKAGEMAPLDPVKVPKKRGRKPNSKVIIPKPDGQIVSEPSSVKSTPELEKIDSDDYPPVGPPESPKASSEAPASTPPIELTKADATKALQAITEKFGMEKGVPIVMQVLSRFGAQSVGKVDPKVYPEFIKFCSDVALTGEV